MDKSMLNLAAVCRKTRALGPGYRAVIWVQGCPFRCKGCISPDWLPFVQVNQVLPHQLAEQLMADPDISGITISGGEPVMQATALVDFIAFARKIRDVNIILFSGYYYENLLAFPSASPVQKLLNQVDVLIDGPYDEKQNDNRGMRGSANQRVIHLTGTLKGYDFETQYRQSEIFITDGELLLVGVPPMGVQHELLNGFQLTQ